MHQLLILCCLLQEESLSVEKKRCLKVKIQFKKFACVRWEI